MHVYLSIFSIFGLFFQKLLNLIFYPHYLVPRKILKKLDISIYSQVLFIQQLHIPHLEWLDIISDNF